MSGGSGRARNLGLVALVSVAAWCAFAFIINLVPDFQLSAAGRQAYVLGVLTGRVAVVGVLIGIWAAVTSAEWSFMGTVARFVVAGMVLIALGAGAGG